MERPNAWTESTQDERQEALRFCEGYKAFISQNKTERECCAAAAALAEEQGYRALDSLIA